MWWSAFVQNKPMPRRCSPTHPEIVKRDLTNRWRETTSYLKTKWAKMRRPQINGWWGLPCPLPMGVVRPPRRHARHGLPQVLLLRSHPLRRRLLIVARRRFMAPEAACCPLLLPLTGDAKIVQPRGRPGTRVPLQGFPWGKQLVGPRDGGWIVATTGTRLLRDATGNNGNFDMGRGNRPVPSSHRCLRRGSEQSNGWEGNVRWSHFWWEPPLQS
jgi:hypothetical protein